MSWLEVAVDCTDDEVEHVSECLNRTGALAVSCVDNAQDDILEPAVGEIKYWPTTRVVGLYKAEDVQEDELLTLLKSNLNLQVAINLSILEEKDWEKEWYKDVQPISFGERLWVYPEHIQIPEHVTAIHLNPGLAFGTGTHATTRLCLQYLDKATVPPMVIDYGCGSGILGIAAIKCGAERVWAIDNDPQAILSTHNNAANNLLSKEQLSAYLPEDFPAIQADLVLANILLAPLMFLRDSFAKHLKPGGHLVVSGLLAEQTDTLRTHYEGFFEVEEIVTDEGWARMSFRLSPSYSEQVSA